jgi:N-hydroxyarylamine O-acetyltransferase
MVLRMPVDGVNWLADVGFGGFGLLEPIRLEAGATAEQGGATYSLRREPGLWVLTMRDRAAATDLYEFTDDPQTPGDVEVANHYTATHPSSMFRRTLTIQRASLTERTLLRSSGLVRFREGRSTEEPIERHQVREMARRLFDIDLPETPLVFESYDADEGPSR